MQFDFSKNINRKKLQEFADLMSGISDSIGFKVSARGWCYICEQAGYIDKSQFDKVENAINRCRKEGLLPVDFVAEEDARAFEGVITPTDGTVSDTLRWMLNDVLNGSKYFQPNWWEDEKYYIQVVVEKIDLKTLFSPICAKYKIPLANAKGWQSILQRAEYSRRFKEAEDNGLQCVLLYAGDHDPDGGRISDTIRKNLHDIQDVNWDDGLEGYNPSNLIIDRFGLEYDFIIKNKYTWIDNLITGSGMDLSSPKHKNHKLPYVQTYLKNVGARKCESNVLVTTPDIGRQLCEESILKYLGDDAPNRFQLKADKVKSDYQDVLNESNLSQPIIDFLK